jgi:hypothetical protein
VNHEIVELSHSGRHAKIYTIINLDTNITLYQNFLQTYSKTHRDEIRDIVNTLELMGKSKGVAAHLIKDKEGSPGDGIVALFDNPDRNLRLYGIKFGSGIIILGGGGIKDVRAWQDDPILKAEVEKLKKFSKIINVKIRERDITINKDDTLEGDLIL